MISSLCKIITTNQNKIVFYSHTCVYIKGRRFMNDIRRKITELAHALYYLADELVAEPTKQNAVKVTDEVEKALDTFAEPSKQTAFDFEDFSYKKERFMAK